MSRENVEIVRQAITGIPRPRRRIEDWLIVHFRPVLVVLAGAVLRLPTNSRLRRALLRHYARATLAAHNRRDLDVTFALLHKDCESTFPPQMGGLGTESGTRGRKERIRFHRGFLDEWGELRYEPEELIDAGDRHLVVGRMQGTGLSSGAAFDNEWALLVATSGGQIVREQVFLDHGDALEAVGLRE